MTTKIIINQDNYTCILELAKTSNSRTDLLKRLGWGRNGTQLNKLNILLNSNNFDYKSFLKPTTLLDDGNTYKKEELEICVKQARSHAEVLRLLQKEKSGSSHKILKRYINKYNIDVSHFNLKNRFLDPKYATYKTNDEIFIENSPVETSVVKNRILKENSMEYKCHGNGCCVTGDWLGQRLTLQLEHKNGNNRDHRLDNLEFLCPNCHSLTETWGGRNIKNKQDKSISKISTSKFVRKLEIDKDNLLNNILPLCINIKSVLNRYELKDRNSNYQGLKTIFAENATHPNVIDFLARQVIKRVNYPSLEELIEKIKKYGFSEVGRQLGCSDNAIRYYLKQQQIDVKKLK